MPFGWSLNPFWSLRLAKLIRERLTQWGLPNSWVVEDILILGQTKAQTMDRASKAVQILTQLGIQINLKKSLSQTEQQVTYLGHIWDLNDKKIKPQLPKVQEALKNVKYQMK